MVIIHKSLSTLFLLLLYFFNKRYTFFFLKKVRTMTEEELQ